MSDARVQLGAGAQRATLATVLAQVRGSECVGTAPCTSMAMTQGLADIEAAQSLARLSPRKHHSLNFSLSDTEYLPPPDKM